MYVYFVSRHPNVPVTPHDVTSNMPPHILDPAAWTRQQSGECSASDDREILVRFDCISICDSRSCSEANAGRLKSICPLICKAILMGHLSASSRLYKQWIARNLLSQILVKCAVWSAVATGAEMQARDPLDDPTNRKTPILGSL
jgi:hypothetical protein